MSFRDNDGRDSRPACPMPDPLVADADEPYIGNLTFREFNICVSGGATLFVCTSMFVLMARHATHFSKPNEQTKIMKICMMLPVYTVLSFITICWPNTYMYLDPWRVAYEAIALGSFFLLLCEFVSPSADFRDVFFAALEVPKVRKAKKKGKPHVQVDGLGWFRKKWLLIFQFVIVSIGCAIAVAITQALDIYCLESSNIRFSHIWLTIVINVSTVCAVVSVLKFYSALKADMKHHKPLAKFFSFKLIIALTLIEGIVFTILRSTGVLVESSKLTYADINFGSETMTTCMLMVPFSIFFHYSYNVSPYDITKPNMLALEHIVPAYSSASDTEVGSDNVDANRGNRSDGEDQQRHMAYQPGGQYYGGRFGLKAWATVLDPSEIIRAISFSFTMRKTASSMGREVVGVNPPGYTPDTTPGYTP